MASDGQYESFSFHGADLDFSRSNSLGQKSSVFRGQWNGGVVAVKVMSTGASSDVLKQKAELATSLSHPNIHPIDGFHSSDSLFLIAPFLQNGNVRQYVNANPNISRLPILLDIAFGMQFLHRRNIIHGSLKAANVLVQNDGTACICDIGIVEVQPSNNPEAHRYWSPEAWKGTTSRGADMYAFAMTAYETLTGATPWGVLSEKHIYQLVVYEHSRPDRPEDDIVCPDHIWAVLESAWHKDARSRPAFDSIVKSLSVDPSSLPANIQVADLSSSFASIQIQSSTPVTTGPTDPDGDLAPPPPAYDAEFSGGFAPRIPPPVDLKGRPPPSRPSTEGTRSGPSSRRPSFEGSVSSTGDRPSRAFHVANAGPSSALSVAPLAIRNRAQSQRTSQSPPAGVARLTASPSVRNPRASMMSVSSHGSSSASHVSNTTQFTTPQHTPHRQQFPDSIKEGVEPFPAPPQVNVVRSNSLTPAGLPAGSGQPQMNHWEQSHLLASRPPQSEAPSPPWNVASMRAGSSVASSTNAVLLAGSLQAHIRNGLANTDPRALDEVLVKIQLLASQSDKDAERLITAGAIPTLIQLLKIRAGEGGGLEGPLMTLGLLAHDSLSANTIYRTGTAQTLIEICSSTGISDDICTLCIWTLNRICRSADIASGLIKAGLPRLLMHKGLKSTNNLTARNSAFCLGSLVYTDAIADMLDMQGIIIEIVDYARRISFSLDSSAEDLSHADDICGALYPIARLSRSIKLAKALNKAGAVPLLAGHLNRSEDPQVLHWAARAVGCLMRPNSGDMAKALLEAGAAQGLARLPSVLPTDDVHPLASFAFAIQRFSCAEWGGGVRKALVEAGVVDSLLAALRTAADEPAPQVHIELALAVSFLGDVGGSSIRKEVVNAGGIDILKRVAARAATETGKEAQEVAKNCNMAVTSITGNIWTRNAASAKTAMTHNWSGGCPDYQPPCPFSIVDLEGFEV